MIKLGQILKKLKSRKKREVIIRVVKRGDAQQLLNLINSIIEENDFIIINKKLTMKEEKEWLDDKIKNILGNKEILICALADSKIIGNCSISKKEGRLSHIGKLGISVMKEYREEGIGSSLIQEALKRAKKLGIKIVILDVFSTNNRALNFYKKFGFKVYGKLPKAIQRKGRYFSDVKMYKELK